VKRRRKKVTPKTVFLALQKRHLEGVLFEVEQASGICMAKYLSRGRNQSFVMARRMLYENLVSNGLSYTTIGSIVGRDHATIISAVVGYRRKAESSAVVRSRIEVLRVSVNKSPTVDELRERLQKLGVLDAAQSVALSLNVPIDAFLSRAQHPPFVKARMKLYQALRARLGASWITIAKLLDRDRSTVQRAILGPKGKRLQQAEERAHLKRCCMRCNGQFGDHSSKAPHPYAKRQCPGFEGLKEMAA